MAAILLMSRRYPQWHQQEGRDAKWPTSAGRTYWPEGDCSSPASTEASYFQRGPVEWEIAVNVLSHLCPAAPSTGGRINSGCCTEQQVGSLAREPLVLPGLHFHSPRVWGWMEPSARPGFQHRAQSACILVQSILFKLTAIQRQSLTWNNLVDPLSFYYSDIPYLPVSVTQVFSIYFLLKKQQKGKITSAANTLWASNGSQMSEWETLTYRLSMNSGEWRGGVSRSFHCGLFADLALRLGLVRLQRNESREFTWHEKAWFWQTHSQHTKMCLNSRLLPYKMPWGAHTTHTLLLKTLWSAL